MQPFRVGCIEHGVDQVILFDERDAVVDAAGRLIDWQPRRFASKEEALRE